MSSFLNQKSISLSSILPEFMICSASSARCVTSPLYGGSVSYST